MSDNEQSDVESLASNDSSYTVKNGVYHQLDGPDRMEKRRRKLPPVLAPAATHESTVIELSTELASELDFIKETQWMFEA